MRTKFRRGTVAVIAALALLGAGLAGNTAAAAVPDQGAAAQSHATPPAVPTTHEVKAPATSPSTAPKGETHYAALDASGKPQVQARPLNGANSNVDFISPYGYCQQGLVYPEVHNTTATTQYYEVQFYYAGSYYYYYGYVNANGYSTPQFGAINGVWTANLYVWNGSYYSYDEYESRDNTCNVSIGVSNTIYSGYVLLTVKNNSPSASASVYGNETLPYPSYGTYTGGHWLYPAAGGGVAYQYFYVGTGKAYNINTSVYGSLYLPAVATGQL
ncbi:MAG TPA: hypothetical protein VLG40_02950 [Candidatus Saccharimonas sp.]|nr:hypothetical protein [Candidatus Saccharimonas sp.]